ncbi:hypothetical protein FEK50_18865 [Escherichia sp. E2586]|nr:hypothetical protein D9737_10150 [Escherichia sp. E10V4]TGC01095.1 hypothetical protein CRG92_07675 [Escherichia sp. E2586]TLI69937.1 hypothetical protein FEK50_18865 [Escherichia sp. E2586]
MAMMLFAKFLSPFVRFSLSLCLIEFYPGLLLFNQYQARYSVNNGVEHINTIILYYIVAFISPPRLQYLQPRR